MAAPLPKEDRAKIVDLFRATGSVGFNRHQN